ncbi:MAG: CSLREA domain-containing protein [Rhodanobacteraceae bacterium]|nr:CSLREA domain-containing protein [Rhodanobacteraceae bacterium]
MPSLRVLDVGLVIEPAGSVLFRTISFVLELDRVPSDAVSVTLETRDGSALAGQDYVRQEGLVVEFAPGETRASASVRIARDSLAEPAENFFLDADTPLGLTIADATGEAIIVASGTPLVVNSTADTDDGLCSPSAGGCTLREAIMNANASAAISEIAFAIPGTQTQVIRPLTPLPPLSRLLTINGYSQPGAVENTVSAGSGNALNSVIKVEIDGGLLSTGNGIKLCAGGTVRGLAIHSFADAAIAADCGVSNQPVAVLGNYLGLKSDGLTPAGNGFGVRAEPTDDGRAQTQFTTGELAIGFANAAARNLISANRVAAIAVAPRQRFVTTSIEGNLIGTDRSGNVPLANAAGIVFTQPHPRCITLLQVRDNVIAASSGDGLRMNVATPPLLPDSCVVQTPEPLTILHNRIGVGLDENAWMPNGGTAIRIDGVIARPPGFASGGDGNTLIGGRFADTQNLLLHQNGAAIVIVGAATRIPISGNRSLNGNQLVDLGGDGPTPNDPGDGDSGPNTLLNAPIPGLAVVDLAARVVRVNYTLDASFSGGDEPRVHLYRVGDTQELVAVDNSVVAGNNSIDLSLSSVIDAGDQLALSVVSPTLGSSELSPPLAVVGVTPALVAQSRLENATPLRATLSLTPAPSVPIAFAVSTRDGSAVAGSDYVALSSTVTLTPAQPSANIDITLLNDSAIENPETLIIDVVPANRGLGVAGVSAEAVIDDDDVRALDQNLYDTLHLSDINGRNGVRVQISGALANSDVRIVGSGDFVDGPEPDIVVSAARTWPSTAGGATATSLYVIPGAATPLPALVALDTSLRSTRINGFDRTLALTMGQVSGDARQELLVGEAYALAGAGRVTLVPGGLPVAGLSAAIVSMPGSRILAAANNAEEAQFGESVSFIGDFDGDGIGDFAATAPETSGSGQTSVNIVYGRAGSFPATLTIASNLAQGGARLVGDAQLSLNRMHVRGIGDFNGDGRNDLAIIGYGGCAVIVPGQAGGYTGRIPISGIAGLIRVCAPFMNEARTSHDRRPLAGATSTATAAPISSLARPRAPTVAVAHTSSMDAVRRPP